MSSNDIEIAMFLQQRLQILDLGSQGKITPAYVYAWKEGVYPFLDDTDSSVVLLPHKLYKKQFLISKNEVEMILEEIIYLEKQNDKFTFWDLEDHLELKVSYDPQSEDRSNLIAICTYFKLKSIFSDEFWQYLCSSKKSPTESGSILENYDPVRHEYFI
jgi:hypothetical protein